MQFDESLDLPSRPDVDLIELDESLHANDELLGEVSDSELGGAVGAGLLSVSPVVAATNAAFDNFSLSSY